MSALPQPSFDEQLVDFCLDHQHNARGFIEAAFPWGEPGSVLEHTRPRKWLLDVADVIDAHLGNPATRFDPCLIAVSSGHGIGKSAGIGQLLNWGLSTMPETRATITANTKGQLDSKTNPEVQKWFNLSITSSWFNATSTKVASSAPKRAISWRADFTPWSKENSEAFQGLHNAGKRILLVFDEASAIDPVIWEVAEGAMTDEETEIIWVVFGNPTQAIGRFRECFRKLRKYWHTFKIDSRDVEGTNKSLFDRWAEQYGDDSDFFKVRVKGEFPTLSLRGMFSEALLDEARGRHLREEQYAFAPRVLSVDPAWEGDDLLVIGMRQGLHYQVMAEVPKNTNDIEVASAIARMQDEHHVGTVNVDMGYGTGIVSAGRTWGRSWNLVPFSGKAPEPGFANMRAWMHYQALRWMQEGGAIPPEPDELYEDLAAVEMVSTVDGTIKLVPKDDMKQLLGQSPNHSDALALTFAVDLPPTLPDPTRLAKKSSRYDNPLQRRLNRGR
jgi:hypothetical protein